MAVIYTVEQLSSVYVESQQTTNVEARKQMLNFILTESANTAKILVNDLKYFARVYELTLQEETQIQGSVSTIQAVGFSSGNVYGYAVAGVAWLYDQLSKKQRNSQVQEGIQKVEALKLKINTAAQLYDTAKKELNLMQIKQVITSPYLWLVIVLVLIIYFSR